MSPVHESGGLDSVKDNSFLKPGGGEVKGKGELANSVSGKNKGGEYCEREEDGRGDWGDIWGKDLVGKRKMNPSWRVEKKKECN